MTLDDLNEDQRIELKQHIMADRGNASYEDLVEAGSLVTDEELERTYGHVQFVPDDFQTLFAEDRDGVLDEFAKWAARLLDRRQGVHSVDYNLGRAGALKLLLDHIEAVRT